MNEWPSWWDWELEMSSHVLKRMLDRQFNEVKLRQMLKTAYSLRTDIEEGRWVVETRHCSGSWEVIVEPDFDEKLLIVIPAYPVEAP